MDTWVTTLEELKKIRFSKFDKVFCKETQREYYIEPNGGSLTPDDLDIIQAAQGGTWRLVAQSASGGGGGGGGEINTGANVGAGAGIFRDKTGVQLNFKSLTAGAGVTLTPSADEIQITATAVAGAVLQEVTATDAGSTTTSLSLVNLNASNVSITPKSTNSILIVDVQFQGTEGLLNGTNTVAHFQLYEIGPAAAIGAENELAANTETVGTHVAMPANIRARLTNASLTARTFQLRGRTSHAGAQAGALNMVWSIREIQA